MDTIPLLRVEMAAVGLTARDLARRAGLDEATLSRLLAGRRRLTPERAHQLIDAIHADAIHAERTSVPASATARSG